MEVGTIGLGRMGASTLAARQQELESIGAAGTVESISADLYESNALAALIAQIDEEPRHITGLWIRDEHRGGP